MANQQIQGTASWGRRVVALVVDWIASSLVSILVLGPSGYSGQSGSGWLTLGVFFLESAVGTALAGGSFGQLVAGVRVLRIDGRRLPVLAALARQILVCVVIPPLVFRPDGRGLHDIMADSAAYDVKALRAGA